MDAPIIKRLHISGLTPNISQKDLETRFASFGKVTALDGLGARDGNGDVRRYAYVTLEGTGAQVSKCLNVLSGATWKGAKLRVGEAKPDYRERITKENAPEAPIDDASPHPAKRRKLARGTQGVLSSDMSLITPSNFSSRSGGWIKTPMGRLVRPMRMRPVRPLPLPTPSTSTSVVLSKADEAKMRRKAKKREQGTLTRARRRVINPLLYGSEYLKGVLLEGGGRILGGETTRSRGEETDLVGEEQEEKIETNAEEVEDAQVDEDEVPHRTSPPSTSSHVDVAAPSSSTRQPASPPPRPSTSTRPVSSPPHGTSNFAQESHTALALLSSLFNTNANDDEDDWGAQESLSDVDVDERRVPAVIAAGGADGDGDGEFEVVPREKVKVTMAKKADGVDVDDAVDEGEEARREKEVGSSTTKSTATKPSATTAQATKLKDMFVPREEDAGFSLLGALELELDLELDEDADVVQAAPLVQHHFESSYHTTSTIAVTARALPSTSTIPPFDPNRTLFFPTKNTSSASASAKGKGSFKDIFSSLSTSLGASAPPFYRTETEDEIRKKWEESKQELTREWKRRAREGVKGRRRGGGFGAGAGVGGSGE